MCFIRTFSQADKLADKHAVMMLSNENLLHASMQQRPAAKDGHGDDHYLLSTRDEMMFEGDKHGDIELGSMDGMCVFVEKI